MSGAVITAVSGFLAAAVGVLFGTQWLNRKNIARLTQSQATLANAEAVGKEADATDVLTGAAVRLVQQANLDRDAAIKARDTALAHVARWQARYYAARAYIQTLAEALTRAGQPIPPPPLEETGHAELPLIGDA